MLSVSPRQSDKFHQWQSRLPNKQLQFAMDLIVLVAAFALAYLLRFDFDIPDQWLLHGLTQLPYVVLIQFVVLLLTGVYAFIWRYIGMAEVKAFILAALMSALPVLILRMSLPDRFQGWMVPRSVIVIDTILGFGGVLGLRVLRRALYEHFEKRQKRARTPERVKRPVLLIGAGRAGVLAAREIQGRGDIDLEVKGFVDDGRRKQGSVIHRIKV